MAVPKIAQVIVIALTSDGVAYHAMTGEAFLEIKQHWEEEPIRWDILSVHPPRMDFHMGVHNVKHMGGRVYETEESTPLYDQARKDHGPWNG